MEDITQNSWFLTYKPGITEEIFNKLILNLKSRDFIDFKHCGFELTYLSFQKNGILRSFIGVGKGDGNGDDSRDFTHFCIDNNKQSIINEIYVDDLLNLQVEPNYEIY